MPNLPGPDRLKALDRMPIVPNLAAAADSSHSSHFPDNPQDAMAAPSADFITGIIVLGIALPALLQVFYASPWCCF